MQSARFADAWDELHRAATAQAGPGGFGSGYEDGLRRLLDALDQETALTATGRAYAFGGLAATLAARVYAERGWAQHPQSLHTPVRAPLVITGIPRTGTTALHKLLSLDPQFQGIERWLAAAPMPRPPRQRWPQIPEYRRCVEGLAAMARAAPALLALHDMSADTVDECLEVLQQGFVSNTFSSTLEVPAYTEWLLQQSEAPSYRRYADVLRLIGMDQPQRRWLLKNPGHTWELETLLELFPDACVVQTHRTPLQALPSLCSVLKVARGIYQGPNLRPERIGPVEARKWRRAVDRTEAARRRHPQSVFDVDHRHFHADPIGVVRAIYERFGLELRGDTVEAMRRWLREQPAEQKSGHRYSAAEFGLDEGALAELFADYIQRYDLGGKGR